MTKKQKEVIYHIDKQDSLILFNDGWGDFADNNGSSHLGTEQISGSSLWHFIQDEETKYFHQSLLKQVRNNNPIDKIPFRCDSPDSRRYMEMSITLVDNEIVEYRCYTKKIESRKYALHLNHTHESDKGLLLKMCSWCNKFCTAPDHWVELEEAVKHFKLFEQSEPPKVTHGMCKACKKDFLSGKKH